jgi:hypothetical protein
MQPLGVVYTGEPDVTYQFTRSRQGYVFGRDDEACDIVIWSALNDQSLSRVAGRIWLMEGELWLRNLSRHHDLTVQVPGMPPEPYLPPGGPPDEPGPARSLPHQTCLVLAPGGCELVVHQAADDPVHREAHLEVVDPRSTVSLPPVPDHLRDIASALCAPLLDGSRLPATYAQTADAVGLNRTRVRALIAELCDLYATAVPQLAASVRARRAAEDALLSAHARHEARLVGGVWRFTRRSDTPDEAELERRRALALPDYYEVAHLLVRRGVIREAG